MVYSLHGYFNVVEHGLTATSHRFFQVSDATNVTLVDHTEELVPEDDTGGDKCSKKKRVPVLAGADELLSTLSQLIIDPITKSETYSVIGRNFTDFYYILWSLPNLT